MPLIKLKYFFIPYLFYFILRFPTFYQCFRLSIFKRLGKLFLLLQCLCLMTSFIMQFTGLCVQEIIKNKNAVRYRRNGMSYRPQNFSLIMGHETN